MLPKVSVRLRAAVGRPPLMCSGPNVKVCAIRAPAGHNNPYPVTKRCAKSVIKTRPARSCFSGSCVAAAHLSDSVAARESAIKRPRRRRERQRRRSRKPRGPRTIHPGSTAVALNSVEPRKTLEFADFGHKMAPQVGLEPTTLRLTAGCSAIELLRSVLLAWRPDR